MSSFQEVHVTQFTDPTTCYSGLKRRSNRLATSTHVIKISSSTTNEYAVSSQELPKPASFDCPCVGYDDFQDDQVFLFLKTTTTSTTSTSTNEPTQQQQQPAAEEQQDSGSGLNASRRTSIASIDAASTAHISDEVVPATIAAATSTAQPQAESSTTPTTAWLVWKRRNETPVRLRLGHRPLTPHLMQYFGNDEIVLWLGSADEARLQCFRNVHHPQNEFQSLSLPSIIDGLENDPFVFTSPIMTLDSCVVDNGDEVTSHFLAVGCQDGTVRVMELREAESRAPNEENVDSNNNKSLLGLTVIQEHTVIIDGPIISIHLFCHHDKTGCLEVIVGSMCGYVCRLTYDKNKKRPIQQKQQQLQQEQQSAWEGPLLLVEGLWNGRLEADDAVLAVHQWQDNDKTPPRIAIGTYAGKVYVYQGGQCTWKCQLPYTIHAISNVKDKLLVTTRRTIHVFQPRKSAARKEQDGPAYSAALAKERLEQLLSERRETVEVEDSQLQNEQAASLEVLDETAKEGPEQSRPPETATILSDE